MILLIIVPFINLKLLIKDVNLLANNIMGNIIITFNTAFVVATFVVITFIIKIILMVIINIIIFILIKFITIIIYHYNIHLVLI